MPRYSYRVYVTERLTTSYTEYVEAESYQEAMNEARRALRNGEFNLDDGYTETDEITVSDVEEDELIEEDDEKPKHKGPYLSNQGTKINV